MAKRAAKKTTDITKTDAPPAFMERLQEGQSDGLEHVGKDDVQMPRLALCQKLSPQYEETNPQYIEGLRIGEFFNNLTGENFGEGPIHFCIIKALKPRGMQLRDFAEGGGIIDRDVPRDDPRMEWGPDGEKPEATLFYDYIIMLLDSEHNMELMAWSLKSTQIKVAKKLNGLAQLRRLKDNSPLYAAKYELTMVMETKNNNTYASHVVKNAGWIEDEDTYNFAKASFKAFAEKADEDIKFQREPGIDDVEFDPSKMEDNTEM